MERICEMAVAWRKLLHCDFECVLEEAKRRERLGYEAANRFLTSIPPNEAF